MGISANLGLLLRDRPLPEAIRAAKTIGFSAVECHWPFDSDPAAVTAALRETGLPMLGLNTIRGDSAAGEFGLAAVPGRRDEARRAIDQALNYAGVIGCRNVHVLAGRAEGAEAFATFADNLAYATANAARSDLVIVIEPLNTRDVPGYFLTSMAMASKVTNAVGAPNLKIMFDCYHMQIMGGDLVHSVKAALPLIGHVQFAAVPDRAEPDHGEVDYKWLLPALREVGYQGFFGAEYKPSSNSFDWLKAFTPG